MSNLKQHAKIMAYESLDHDEESLLNPYKNSLSKSWNAETYAERWKDAFHKYVEEAYERLAERAEEEQMFIDY